MSLPSLRLFCLAEAPHEARLLPRAELQEDPRHDRDPGRGADRLRRQERGWEVHDLPGAREAESVEPARQARRPAGVSAPALLRRVHQEGLAGRDRAIPARRRRAFRAGRLLRRSRWYHARRRYAPLPVPRHPVRSRSAPRPGPWLGAARQCAGTLDGGRGPLAACGRQRRAVPAVQAGTTEAREALHGLRPSQERRGCFSWRARAAPQQHHGDGKRGVAARRNEASHGGIASACQPSDPGGERRCRQEVGREEHAEVRLLRPLRCPRQRGVPASVPGRPRPAEPAQGADHSLCLPPRRSGCAEDDDARPSSTWSPTWPGSTPGSTTAPGPSARRRACAST